MRNQQWWDDYFLGLALMVGVASKDPSTQVGAIIVRPDRTVASVGYNGFPKGIADDERLQDRETKYKLMVHGEINAVLHAREPLHNYTLYTHPFLPCIRCAAQVIQTGIKRVVSYQVPAHLQERWGAEMEEAKKFMEEGGITVTVYD